MLEKCNINNNLFLVNAADTTWWFGSFVDCCLIHGENCWGGAKYFTRHCLSDPSANF